MKDDKELVMKTKVMQLKQLGLNISQISRHLKLPRYRIYKYINRLPGKSQKIRLRKKKLDKYHDEILQHLKSYSDVSAAQISTLLRKQFGELGVCQSTVANYVRMMRKNYDIPKQPVLDNDIK